MTHQTQTIAMLYGKPIVQRVTPTNNGVQLNPPLKQHHHTIGAIMADQIEVVRRLNALRVFIVNFLTSMVVVYSAVALYGWVMS